MRNPVLPILVCAGMVLSAQAPKASSHAEGMGMGFHAGSAANRGGMGMEGARASGFANVGRPAGMIAPRTNLLLAPGALPRCLGYPDSTFWQGRDIMGEIERMARRGFIPVASPGDVPEFQDYAYFPAGWKAYGFVVPGKEKLHVRLHHANEGWFRLLMVDRWGLVREGMLQNKIPTGNPEVRYNNPMGLPNTVYVIVDDPGWMSSKKYPYTIDVERTWDPAKLKTPQLPVVHGIWAQTKAVAPKPVNGSKPAETPEAKPAPAA